MAEDDQNIRRPDPPPGVPGDRARRVLMGQAGCARLAERGVFSLGIDERPIGSAWGRGLSPTCLLFVVAQGEVELVGRGLRAVVGSCLKVPPEVPKRLRTVGDSPVRAFFIHLQTHGEPGRSISRPPDQPRSWPAPEAPHLLAACEGLIQESRALTEPGIRAARAWSEVLLSYLDRLSEPEAEPQRAQQRARLEELWRRVSAEPGGRWSVRRMAELAHLSPGGLHRLVQRVYGDRPMGILRRIRLERACDLLRTTDRTLEDIAQEVGYATGFALSNAMKRSLGIRPKQVRLGESAPPPSKQRDTGA